MLDRGGLYPGGSGRTTLLFVPILDFPPYRLDTEDQRLWRGDRPIELRPKTHSVLAHLLARAPSLVGHEERKSSV